MQYQLILDLKMVGSNPDGSPKVEIGKISLNSNDKMDFFSKESTKKLDLFLAKIKGSNAFCIPEILRKLEIPSASWTRKDSNKMVSYLESKGFEGVGIQYFKEHGTQRAFRRKSLIEEEFDI